MKLTYTKITAQHYDAAHDKTEEYGYEFEYEPPDDEVVDFLCELIYEEYFHSNGDKAAFKKAMRHFIFDNEIQPILEEYYNDLIKAHFYRQAMDSL